MCCCVTVINEKRVVARKDYTCDSCLFLREGLDNIENRLTEEERASIEKAKANGWKILKGQQYIRQFNSTEGQTYTFKSIPEIHNICIKYELYGDC